MKRIFVVVALAFALLFVGTPAHADTAFTQWKATTCYGQPKECRVGETVPVVVTSDGTNVTLLDSKGKRVKATPVRRVLATYWVIYLFPKETLQPGSYTLKIKPFANPALYYGFNFDGVKATQ